MHLKVVSHKFLKFANECEFHLRFENIQPMALTEKMIVPAVNVELVLMKNIVEYR